MATLATTQRLESLEPLALSPIEAAFWRVEKNFAGAYRAVVLFRLDGCIQAGPLAAALRHLQYRHPKLRAMVAQADDGRLRYQFEPEPPPIPFEITDYAEHDLPWREETRRLLERGFPEAGPLAAVAILRCPTRATSDLLVMVHHAIADGLSAIMLVDDLLTEYARAEARVDLPPRPALQPVTAFRAKSSGGWLSRLWLLRRFMRLQRADRRSVRTPLPQAPGILPQSQWMHWVFSREDTHRLVRRCRKERTSLGGALVAAVCCGLMDCLPVGVGFFKCQFPLNVRESLEALAGRVTPEDLGCFVSIMNELYEVPRPPSFWSLARRAHQALQAFTRHGGPSFGYNMAAVASTGLFERAVPRLMASPHRVTLLANNYGVLNVRDAYGSLRPRECTLTFKNYEAGPSLVIQALVMGQRLNVGLVADGLDPAFWKRVHVAVHQRFATASIND
jgi:Condensation domain